MKISIIGSNSLLASYLIDDFAADSQYKLALFGRTKRDLTGSEGGAVEFFLFSHPEQPLPMHELLASDAIIYCAAAGVQANSNARNEYIHEVNAFLPIKIISYLQENNYAGKWISFGTYFEIGDNDELRFFSEKEVVLSDFAIPNTYCLSKRLLSRFFNGSSLAINWWHLMLPTIYGAKENQARLIPYIVSSLKKSELPKLSSGKQIRQYLHCLDVVEIIRIILHESVPKGIHNVANQEAVRVAELAQVIFDKFNQNAAESLGLIQSRDETMKVLLLDPAQTTRAIPQWKQKISLSDGIMEYL
jgi:nucleoside-diphosphate-sugar epimerase